MASINLTNQNSYIRYCITRIHVCDDKYLEINAQYNGHVELQLWFCREPAVWIASLKHESRDSENVLCVCCQY